MSDIVHQALERHIDLQHPDLAEVLNGIAELRKNIDDLTYNFQESAPTYIDSTRKSKAFTTQDYFRALQMGGYGYSVTFPRPASTLAANNDYPLSIYNSGNKTYVIFSIEVNNVTASGSTQVYLLSQPSPYGIAANQIPAPITNHKAGVSNGPAITAIYNQVSTGLVAPSTAIPGFVDAAAYGANANPEIITNANFYTLPPKTYCEVWFRVLTASVVFGKVDLIELEY